MSVYLFTELFYLLLFLLMCGTLCGHVYANSATQPSNGLANIVELFKLTEEKISTALTPDGDEKAEEITVKEYYSPALVSANNVIVALAALNNTDKIDNNITVLSKYLLTKSETNWGGEVVENSGSKWIARFAVYKRLSPVNSDRAVVRGLVAAAVNENKIYVLLVNASSNSANSAPNGELTLELDCRLVVGTVTNGDKGKITWVEEKLNNSESQKFKEQIKEQTLTKGAFSGSAIVTEEGKILFLLKARTNVKKTVFGFLYPDVVDTAKTLKLLSFDDIAQGCYPQFFLWGKNIIMVPTDCKGGVSDKKVMEVTEVIETQKWINSSGPFSHFVEFFQDKSDFTTANIKKNTNDNNDVLLFTQKKSSKEQTPGNNNNRDVSLWATNGKRFYNVGEFLINVNVTSINILYTNDELLVFYQKRVGGNPTDIALMRLKTQLSDIRTVIAAWKTTDESVKQLCGKKILCDNELSTDGLVGFLSNNSEDTKWKDEYYYLNATLKSNSNKKPEKVTDGFMFSGEGVGAQWPVKKDKNEDQPYKFTDPGFTLVATVKINKHVETVGNSLLGVKLSGQTRHIGLWCSKNKKWAVSTGGGSSLKESDKICKPERQYSVAFVLRKPKIFVYVNWEEPTFLNKEEIKIENEKIKSFYFGADTDVQKPQTTLPESHVTVTNVFLYNRPFDKNEIESLKQKVKPIEDIELPDQNGDKNTAGGSDQSSSTPMLPSTDEEEDGEESLQSRTEDGGVGGGVRVLSLLLVLLCVSAPLLHL